MNAHEASLYENVELSRQTGKKNPHHRKQIFWQIWCPLLISVLIIVALAIYLIKSSALDYAPSQYWANISIIIMVLLAVIPGLLLLILLTGMNYGIGKLIAIIPLYLRKGQAYLAKAATILHTGADKVVAPLLLVESSVTGGKAFLAKLRRLLPGSKRNL